MARHDDVQDKMVQHQDPQKSQGQDESALKRNNTQAGLHCAICNKPNLCTGSPTSSCWCFSITLTTKEQQQIASLRSKAVIEKSRCICQNCLRDLRGSETTLSKK